MLCCIINYKTLTCSLIYFKQEGVTLKYSKVQKSHTKQIHREGGVLANQQHRTRCQIFGEVHVRQQRRLHSSTYTAYGVATV